MNKLRKFFASAVIVMTVVAMSGVMAPKANAAAQAGDLIKKDGLSTVYYLGADSKRYVFPSESVYFSWYKDFSSVVTISATDLASYPLGANVTMRPGTKLIKITTDPKVYAVEPNGVLRYIQSETQAAGLYGTDWAKRVVDVADSYFTNYSTGAALPVGTFPVGSLVKNTASTDVYYYDGTSYRLISTDAAFNANGFMTANVLSTATNLIPTGAAITGMETALTKTSQSGTAVGVIVGAGTGMTVSLASDTAPAATLIYGQASANLGSFNLSASADGAVTVTSLKVKRVGISSDALLSAVYLYEGMNRLTDSATVSSNYITFNNPSGLFTIAAGTTKKITVKSNISSTTTDGANVAVSIDAAANIVAGGAAISGSFPLTGNTMSVSSATLAAVTLAAPTPTGATDVDAGQTDLPVWKSNTTIGTRDVYLNSIRFRQIGSISATDLKDLTFYVDGVKKGTAQQLGTDSYVTFDFTSAPVTLAAGTRILELRANIVGGSSKTYSFSVQQATDLLVADSQYGAFVTATTFPATTGTATIAKGSMTVTLKSDSTTGNVTKDATGVSLAKYEFKAYGESLKVEYLKAGFTSANDATIGKLRNGAIFANGVQVGSTADLVTASTTGTTFSLGSSLVVTPGTPVTVEIRADIYDNDGTNGITATDTLRGNLMTYTNGVQRQTSLDYITTFPSIQTNGNTLTVQIGTITLAKQTTYGNQNVVLPNTGFKLGAFTLTGNNIEDSTLNSFTVDFTSVTNTSFAAADLSDVYIKYGTKTTSVKSTVSATGNVWSISEPLAKNASMVIEIYGNVGSIIDTNDSIKSVMTVAATTNASSQSINSNTPDGQTIIAKTGTIGVSLDASTQVTKIVVGNTATDLATFRFTTTNDNYTITEIVATSTTNGITNIGTLSLKDGATVIATVPLSGSSATFSGLNIPVAANSYKALTLSGNLGTVGFGAGVTGANVMITVDSWKANNSQGTESSDGVNVDGTNIYVYKATPTVSNQALPSTLLTAGTQTISKFSITANTNTIGWKKLAIGVSKTSAPTIATTTASGYVTNGTGSVSLYDADTNTLIPGTIKLANVTGSMENAGAAATGLISFIATDEQSISGTKTYLIKATVGGTITSGESVSTSFGSGVAAYAASAAYATVAGLAGTLVWSDQAGDATTPTHSLTSLDWNNDWLVKNIPTDSQTLSK
jgi:hypothetical protein